MEAAPQIIGGHYQREIEAVQPRLIDGPDMKSRSWAAMLFR